MPPQTATAIASSVEDGQPAQVMRPTMAPIPQPIVVITAVCNDMKEHPTRNPILINS